MKRNVSLLAIFFALSPLVTAQTNELPAHLTKGRILTAGGEKLTFTNLTTGSGVYQFTNTANAKTQTIPADNVLSIERQTGTEAGKWALLMGGAGLLGSVIGVLSAKRDAGAYGGQIDDSKLIPIVLGITAASSLIGLAIGSGKKKYSPVYTNPKYDTSSLLPALRIGLTCSAQLAPGLALHYNF